jgi:NADP-dependent 3-hydroxy acid dehydrogenase YdfG
VSEIMTVAGAPATGRAPALAAQTVVLIGGSAGIGLETARRARAEGAEVVLAARDPDRLTRAAREVGARHTAAFDASDAMAVRRFFDDLTGPIDHVLVTAGGPYYGPCTRWMRSRCDRRSATTSWWRSRWRAARHPE